MIDLFNLAIKNMGRRKKRAALTMLGIFIGIAAVVSLVSLGEGLQKTINDQFAKIGTDKVLVQAKEIGFGGEHAPGKLTQRELHLVNDVHGVTQSAGMLLRAASTEFNNIQRTLLLSSLPTTASEATLVKAWNTWEVEHGRLLSHKDTGKTMVGYSLANRNTFGKNIQVGDKLTLNNKILTVVGTLQRVGDPGIDGGIVLSEQDLRNIVNDSFSYSFILAQVIGNPDIAADHIEKALRRDRHQKKGKEDFTVQSATELISSFNNILNVIQIVFIGVATISLLVGGIGIMNTMFTAVLERTREIGVMKAIGARNKDILTLFVLESGMLGLAGGIIGVLIGIGLSKTVELGANASFGPGTLYAFYPPWLIIGTVVFSTSLGAISGMLPARRASKLKPVDALRYE